MEATLELFQMDGEEDEFYKMRPTLDHRQVELLSCYYSARRDVEFAHRIKEKDLFEFASSLNYETDIAITVLKSVDDHYVSLCVAKQKRESAK